MNSLIKCVLCQALGTNRGNIVYNIYVATTGTDAGASTQAVLLVILQWVCGQLLGATRGAAAYGTVAAIVAGTAPGS